MADMSGVLPTFVCVAIALVLGGGGSSAPAAELAVQLLTALCFAAWAWLRSGERDGRIAPGAWLIALTVVAVPLLQLIPLPPSVWHGLAGRDVERQALALIGQADSWRPISLFPGRTLASLLAMIAAAVLLPMIAAMRVDQFKWLLVGIVLLALLSVLVGVTQMAGVVPLRFYLPYQTLPVGFQASRNFQAEVLNLGILCAGAASRLILRRSGLVEKGVRVVAANFFCTLLLETAQVLGASRMGLALSPVAMLGQAIFLWPALQELRGHRIALTGVAVGALALLGALVSTGDAQLALGRFAAGDAMRVHLTGEALAIRARVMPLGGGVGSFLPLYEANERLDDVSVFYISRAHDDYLEMMVETGWMGPIAILVVAMLWGRRVWQLWSSGSDRARTLCLLSVFSLSLIAVHSLVDYPLRSMTLAALAAIMTGMVFCRDGALGEHRSSRHRSVTHPSVTKVSE